MNRADADKIVAAILDMLDAAQLTTVQAISICTGTSAALAARASSEDLGPMAGMVPVLNQMYESAFAE